MKKLAILLVLMCLAPMAYAASSVSVPGDYTTIQAAVDAVDEGGTVTITDSAIYTCTNNLVFRKGVKLFAAVGQTPTIRNSNTTNAAASLYFTPTNTANSQIGSLTGGRIKLELIKATAVTGSVYNPTMFIRLNHTTGTLVTLENLDMLETGVTTVAAINGIMHYGNYKSDAVINYVDFDINRPTVTGAAYGVVVGDSTTTVNSTTQGGPNYTLNHVRLKNYSRAGVWNHFTSSTITLNYYESGTLGERQGTLNYPWSGFINNNGPATLTARFSNSIMRGSAAYDACNLQTNGSSMTLSRCVFLNGYSISTSGMAGAIRLGGVTSTPVLPGVLTVAIDHCDIVDTTAYGTNVGAIVRGSSTANEARTTVSLTLTNSIVYSLNNRAVNIPSTNGGVTYFTSSHNNVFGSQTSNGYTAGTGDISFDPLYFNATAGDMRYYNNTLKTADTEGKPVGTNGDYSDVWGQGIIAGPEGEINAARHWETMN